MMFTDQVVWITGASAGIGRELAFAFADRGADVAVSARRGDRLAEVVAGIEARGRRGLAVPCDVTDEAAVSDAVEAVVRHFGRLDVAVANAGYGVRGRIEELSAEHWRRQLDVNVVGLALTARYAIPALRRTSGRLALVGSVAGMLPAPGSGAYTASKAAVEAIGRTLSVELHGSGVTCTTILPGFVESDIARVDNAGVFHPDREDRRPARLMWPADRAARVMVRAIHRRRREFVFTAHGKVFGYLGRHWPGLIHFAMTRRR
jgi:NAD(P)-dependent dehydrogenase (short-subunit alcohol dehydrogenase family)